MKNKFPQRFWDWYAENQARLCPVHKHGQLSDHTIKELAQCAVEKGVIGWADVPEDFKKLIAPLDNHS